MGGLPPTRPRPLPPPGGTAADDAANHAGEAADQAAEAAKQATAAKVAADTATAAVRTAQKTFDIARETEAEDLKTRTNAGVESAMTHKATADTFTVEVSKTVLEGQSITDDTKALAAEARRPDTDETAIAVKGRAVALRALKYFGSWRKDAAAQALSGSDADVIAYLRTGWDKAVADETRQQVSDLASGSPYAAVRTAATEALNGSAQQILDFYTSGQHQVANADYRVAVSKLFNDGGPGVKEAAKKALEDGSTQALLGFLNNGQYAALQTDERVTASKLYNDGGPEVKAAAKIALAGSVDEVHTFVEAGQYMADRKDQLASNHIAQVERLIAEGLEIAANARRNSHLAAQAAFEAKGAAADAEKAKNDAAQSATEAAGYAAEADKAADRAETSATKAKTSATTARAAANRADQDAVAAEESAAQAEFSADYARASATSAAQASDDARQSALDAGKSSAEADELAEAAWKDVVKKREVELAEERRLAEEARKKQRDAENKPKCYIPMNRDSLPPCALAGQDLVFPTIDPVMKELAWEVLGLNDAKDCIENPKLGKCALAAMSFLPIGKLKLIKKGAESIEDITEASRATRVIKCATCFLAGTKVLMADGSRQAIETVGIGDQVIATDPGTGDTQARTVEEFIVTGMDTSFNELSIGTTSGTEHLTATYEHPFWSPSEGSWVKAGSLHPGMTLRTVDGSTATIEGNRSFTQHARTYNLTVDGLHTYYVSAGNTPVLVHNEVCGVRVSPVASDWATKGAHLHVGADEVHVFSHEGELGAKGIRLKTGMASDKSVQKVLDTLKSSPELRKDLIQKARAAQKHMNTHNWGNASNRALELQFLIKALEKLG
ncbi:polymorphic toxin-type HINT domain-containing protein [Streptomyces sp. NPDC127079]|uniref:polymorphic toxin-type HINT domain-containing protein n=1 Tax=Streptomyces sp. NPDC127079 TaxID=3347132 RepID=UPI0036686599